MKQLKKLVISWALSLALVSNAAHAGGGMGGGATEVTQIINMVQLVLQYTQMLESYSNQLQQYDTMVTNLKKNPSGVSLSNLHQMAGNAAKLMDYGKNIGSSLAQVDENFAKTFDNPTAQGYADKFKSWTAASQDGIKSAMRNAGMQREQFQDDTSALQSLMSQLAATDGNLGALQALGALNARQVQESMKLRDLISEQQIAQNNYLMASSKKEGQKEKIAEWLLKSDNKPLPKISDGPTQTKPLFK